MLKIEVKGETRQGERTAVLRQGIPCPKCGTILFKMRRDEETGPGSYYCLACGLEGTLPVMECIAATVKLRMEEDARRKRELYRLLTPKQVAMRLIAQVKADLKLNR